MAGDICGGSGLWKCDALTVAAAFKLAAQGLLPIGKDWQAPVIEILNDLTAGKLSPERIMELYITNSTLSKEA